MAQISCVLPVVNCSGTMFGQITLILLLLQYVLAPPTTTCVVQMHIFHGTKSTCGHGEMQKLSELAAETLAADEKYGSLNKADLILSRGAIFDSEQRNLENLYICAKHCSEFGTDWKRHNRPTKKTNTRNDLKCNMPELIGFNSRHKSVFAQYSVFLTKEQSKAIWMQSHTLVPLGTGK